jgi:S1-C subfamily serine protease
MRPGMSTLTPGVPCRTQVGSEGWKGSLGNGARAVLPDPPVALPCHELVPAWGTSRKAGGRVASTDAVSYYMTNAHVVGDATEVMLYRQVPEYAKMLGTVLAKGDVDSPDLAIVSVAVPSIVPVVLHSALANCESPVGLAGYPRAQIWAAETLGELMPAIHTGTITAVNKTGAAIVHDAVSRPGSSGGPLFDPSTGEVYGIEKSGWDDEQDSLAIGASVMRTFLEEHGVKLADTPV